MKRIFTTLILILAFANVFAQSETSIVIDQKSFRPIQTDALTGINIDPIATDSSRRPCARIKVRVNRMTAEDINGIEVKIITNNELRKCKTAEYDNGLIIEMTAKYETRFYFYHPRLGYSNEVTVNLEANKEYRLDAYMNQQLSITINTDIAGADIYLDQIFRGQSNNDNSFVIHDVAPGDHKLRIEYADKRSEQTIYVSSNKLVFTQDVLTAENNPQIIDKPSNVQYHYEVRTKKVRHLSDRRGGFEHSVSAGIHIWDSQQFGYYPITVNYTAGYRTKSNIFIGAGIGIDMALGILYTHYTAEPDSDNGYWSCFNDNGLDQKEQILPISKIQIPLFAHVRYYITKGRWQPFISLSLGAALGKKNDVNVYAERSNNFGEYTGKNFLNKVSYSSTGVFAEPMFGIDFRMTEKSSISLQVGGVFQTLPVLYESNGIGAIKSRIQSGLSGKIGFTF